MNHKEQRATELKEKRPQAGYCGFYNRIILISSLRAYDPHAMAHRDGQQIFTAEIFQASRIAPTQCSVMHMRIQQSML